MKREGIGGRSLRVALVAAWLAGGAAIGIAAQERGASKGAAPAQGPVVARVGNMEIRKAELDQRYAVSSGEYRRRAGKDLTPQFARVLRRVTLETLIRDRLLILEAKRRGITVGDAEAEAEFERDPYFQDNGVFNAARLENVKRNSPSAFAKALAEMKDKIAGRKLNARLASELRPEDARVRADAERAVKTADVSFYGLRYVDVSPDLPEPPEADIVAYYRSHQESFRVAPTAWVSIVEVMSPSATPGDPALRGRAQRALEELQAGGSLALVGEATGAAASNISISSDSLPAFWQSRSRKDLQDLLATPPGSLLDRPVPSSHGWAVVRVDSFVPTHIAPLASVASRIRAKMRGDIRAHYEVDSLRAEYEARKQEFVVRAARVRYAVLDTAGLEAPEPTAEDLDVFYRGHMADYTSYDAPTASIKVKPLAEVRDDVRLRWKAQRAASQGREWADQLSEAWSGGKRDRRLERQATLMRDVGPVPEGAPVDTGLAGRILTEAIGPSFRADGGIVSYADGFIVYALHDQVERYQPTFEQLRERLAAERASRRAQEEERGAYELYTKDPVSFATGAALFFSRAEFEVPKPIDVPLTRAEVEHQFQVSLDKYSSPDQRSVRHILISPKTPDAAGDAAAHALADSLYQRILAGERFEDLAREYSDDPPSAARGGDLGYFQRGAMIEAFEDVAFSLGVGEVSPPVRTEIGYHIIKCEDAVPMYVEPLEHIYTTVGMDAAMDKGIRIARATAESLYHACRTPAELEAGTVKLGGQVHHYRHEVGQSNRYPEVMRPAMRKLETMKAGDIYPGAEYYRHIGACLLWVDSIAPPKPPQWGEARERALDAYRALVRGRAFESKRAELDSLLAAGWTFDALGDAAGGLTRASIKAGDGLAGWKPTDTVDSLVFGVERAAVLEPGDVSDWVPMREGAIKVRVDRWDLPSPSEMASRIEARRAEAAQTARFDYFEGLKLRYPVNILEAELKGVPLPEIQGTASR